MHKIPLTIFFQPPGQGPGFLLCKFRDFAIFPRVDCRWGKNRQEKGLFSFDKLIQIVADLFPSASRELGETAMKHVVLGTAGHVDHGKTALIKAITGIDTDRLKEEKERGITIELGFAPLVLPGGLRLGVVDVPGHERFVKNMVAGAGGLDMVILVIAADEGVMPQTREHLDICTLLGVKKGVVALTKTDLVDEDWLSLVQEDIREFLRGTFLEHSPLIPLSVVANRGLGELIAAIEEVASGIEESPDAGIFRLPIDRVFTMKGFGTVVTGTVISGTLKTGEAVEVYPGRIKAKVRGIQVHNETAESALTGQRAAINLQGVEKENIQRGNVLSHPNTLEPAARFDARLTYLPSAARKMKNRALVRFHTGTSEVIARIILLDRDDIGPGEESDAQVLLESPAAAMTGDRFVVRSYSPVRTIGGGEILDPLPRKHKRHHPAVIEEMKVLREGIDPERTSLIIRRAGLEGITAPLITVRTGINPRQVSGILQAMYSRKEALLWDREAQRVVSFPVYQGLQERAVAAVRSFHEKHPLKAGMPKEELRMTLGNFIDTKLFNAAIRDLEKAGTVSVNRENIQIPDHRVHLEGDLEELRERIRRMYLEAGLAPPTVKELMEKLGNRTRDAGSVLKVMAGEGVLIKVDAELYYHADNLQKLREDYRNLLIRDGKSTPATFRDLTGLSRKFIISLMEYFDAAKLTIRVGDHRVLRDEERK
jgi:selenocysteine-specific elongation factor